MIYLLDTNAVSDLIANHSVVIRQVEQHRLVRDHMTICQPVYYELMRGLIRTNATQKLSVLRNRLLVQFDWVRLEDVDWLQAAQFWSHATRAGKQLSDMDFLLAAIAFRLSAVVVSSDSDFDALPIIRQNWRVPPPET